MDERAVSPLIAMILILAIISTAISVISAQLFPAIIKNAEIQHNERLKDEFMSITTFYSMFDEKRSKCISLKLGTSNLFGQTVTSSSLSVVGSGYIVANLTCNQTSLNLNYRLFRINLSIHNSLIPDQTLVFSECGIKIYQDDNNITRLNPDILLRFNNTDNTLFLSVDNFTGNSEEVSGSGVAFLSFNTSVNHLNYLNCTGDITVSDEVFGDEWRNIMRSLNSNIFSYNSSTNTLWINSPINISLEIRDFRMSIN